MILNHNSVIGFIGTYTGIGSDGLYKFSFDTNKGKFEKITLAYKIDDPASIAIDTEINVLYSTCKIDAKCGISSFKFWKEKDSLNLINYNLLEDKEPCHLNVCSDKQLLVSSNYDEGTMIVYNTLNGIVLSPLKIITHDNCTEASKSHICSSIFTKDNKYIVSVNMGMDTLSVYKLDNNNLIEIKDANYHFPEGSGPNKIVYCKTNNCYYLISKFTSEIFVFHYSPSKEIPFSLIQKINTLPDNHENKKSGAAICIHKNNKFLYTADSENNSITLFHINNSTGRLKYIAEVHCEGNSPNDLAIDPSGKFLLCTNEKSNNISAFLINKLTGELNFTSSQDIGSPSSIKFL